jgi:AcrR family transcriptional regulator
VTRRRDAVENEHEILSAFGRLLQKDPAIVPSMSDVVRESGLGRATVYRHFPDIGSLVFRHLDTTYSALFTRWRAELGAGKGPVETLANICAFITEMRKLAKANLSVLLDAKCQASFGYARARRAFRNILSLAIVGNRPPSEQEATIIDLLARHGEAEQIAYVCEATESSAAEADAALVRSLVTLVRDR